MLIHLCLCALSHLGMSGLVFGLGISPWFYFATPVAYAALAAAYLIILLFISFFLPTKKPGKSIPFCRFILYHSLRWFLVLFHTRVVIEGEDKLPKEPFVLISNHRSNLDPIVTFAAFPKRKLSFVSKVENMKIPVAGPFIAASGFLGIERGKPKQSVRIIEKAADMVKDEGFDFGIYPEGTRSKTTALLPFKLGAYVMAQRAEAPMVVMLTEGTRDMRFLNPKRTTVRLSVLTVLPKEEVLATDAADLAQQTRQMFLDTGIFDKE